jgi:hypothetical protein
MRKLTLALSIAVSLFAFAATALSQTTIEIGQSRNGGERGAAPVQYHYLFENQRFTVPIQEMEFDGDGQGKFRFKRKDGEEIVNQLSVSPAILSQIQSLFDELNFLASTENYQHKKDFSHLGTTTITYTRNGQGRTISFNYTDSSGMNRLNEIFRNLITQETRVFELETVWANDPISTPAQLRLLESEMKSKRIADPQRFVPMLKNLRLDEGVPLIARNHADRLLQAIRKGK